MFICCEEMRLHITDTHLIDYNEKFDEYGIPYREDNVSMQEIHYCPWCGKKLPDSRRDDWFEALERLGYENPLFREDIPAAYQSAQWRRKQ